MDAEAMQEGRKSIHQSTLLSSRKTHNESWPRADSSRGIHPVLAYSSSKLAISALAVWRGSIPPGPLLHQEASTPPVSLCLSRRSLAGTPSESAAMNSMEIRAEPDGSLDGETRLQRGLSHLQSGNLEQAIAELTVLLRLDPAHGAAALHRAECYRLKGDYERALADYETAGSDGSANFRVLF